VIAVLVPESKNPNRGRIDVIGVLASIAGLVLLVYGIIQGGDKGSWIHWDVIGTFIAGLLILAFFAWYETRISHPSLDVRLFRDPRLSSAIGALSLVFFGMLGALFFLNFYLQTVRGYSPLHAGAISLAFAVAQMSTAPRSAGLVRRFGTKSVIAGGLVAMTVALAGYQLLGETTPIWVLCVLFFIQGIGMGVIMPPATEAVMSVVPRERAGSGSALTNTARQVSGALGVAVLGSILAQAYRSQLSPQLGSLPASARNAAASSITASQAVAAKLGAAGRGFASAADSSFVHAMHVTTLISAAITLLGAIVVLRWMPGRAAAAPAAPAPATDPAAAHHAVVEPVAALEPVSAAEPVGAVLATADHAIAAQLASPGDAVGGVGPVPVEG